LGESISDQHRSGIGLDHLQVSRIDRVDVKDKGSRMSVDCSNAGNCRKADGPAVNGHIDLTKGTTVIVEILDARGDIAGGIQRNRADGGKGRLRRAIEAGNTG
jgi:hypothetical protein